MTNKTLGSVLFRWRSFVPLPFLAAAVLGASPTALSLAAGGAIIAVGEALRLWAVRMIGAESRTTTRVGGTRLITGGPYAHVRNPLYLGNMLIYTGVGITSLAFFPWLTLVGLAWFAFQYSAIIENEEGYLAQTFPEEFRAYSVSVPKLLPRLRPWTKRAAADVCGLTCGLRSERSTIIAIVTAVSLILAVDMMQH